MGTDKLFRAKVRCELGDQVVWFRALSDQEIQERDEHALLKMVRRRKAIEDPSSTANEIFIQGIQMASDDELRRTIIGSNTFDFQREANAEVKPQYFIIPDGADEKEKAEILAQREADRERMNKEVAQKIEARVKTLTEKLAATPREQLIQMAIQRNHDTQARLTSLRAFQDFTVYASVYTDENLTQRMFEAPEIVSQLDPTVRVALVTFYFDRVDTITTLDLQYFFSTDGSRGTANPTPSSAAEPKTLGQTPSEKSRGGGRKSS